MDRFVGHLAKMKTHLGERVEYQLPLDDLRVPLNELLGRSLKMTFDGVIHCQECGRKIKKTYNEGHCYPCTMSLASADMCILKPEQCHYHLGTCREPEWGLAHCMTTHYVYLANSSGIKVGITRGVNIPYRWMDQGAAQALPILKVSTRLQSGKLEVLFKSQVADKTNWRKMLTSDPEPRDLKALRDEFIGNCRQQIDALAADWGEGNVEELPDAEIVELKYPILNYPTKVKSFNFTKAPVVEGVLQGIKGQYMIFDTGVINIRKFAGYQIELTLN